MKILAIESSCDEFAMSLIVDDEIKCNVISSQIKEHSNFGGVVPELAARLHLENLNWVFGELVKETKIDWNTLDYIAYTVNPGLLGSLMIGKIVSETLSIYFEKPLLPLNHIEGHIFACSIEQSFEYPVLALVVSGGHTQIELVNSPNEFIVIGQTVDDAIGECYDKVGRILGFKYPGGSKIDKLAQKGNFKCYNLPLAKNDDTFDFSYSGLKTATINLFKKLQNESKIFKIENFCASFQFSATKIIEIKLEKAIKKLNPKTLVVAGGVSANSAIRNLIVNLGNKYKISKTILPNLEYCTDNAAMIAKLASEKIKLT